MKVPIKDLEEKGDVKVVMHQQDDDLDASVEEYKYNGCIRTMGETNLTLSLDQARLGVVRCILVKPEQPNDWKITVIFQTCTKIENTSYKVIVDSGSCINAIVSELITTFWMKPVKHPTWIDTTS